MNSAALELQVLRTTLKDCVLGRIVYGSNKGPKTYLTNEEEKELANSFLAKLCKNELCKNKTRCFEDST